MILIENGQLCLTSESGKDMTFDDPSFKINNGLLSVMNNGIMDIYFVRQGEHFLPNYFDTMSNFGGTDNPHVPQFQDIGLGEFWTLNGKDYKIYISDVYSLTHEYSPYGKTLTARIISTAEKLAHLKNRYFRPIDLAERLATGKTNTAQTSYFIDKIAGEFDGQLIEAMRHMVRVIGLAESNIIPHFDLRYLRVSGGKLILFNIFDRRMI